MEDKNLYEYTESIDSQLRKLRKKRMSTIFDLFYLLVTLAFGIYMMVLCGDYISADSKELLATFGINSDNLSGVFGNFLINIILFQLFFTGIWGSFGWAKKGMSKKRLVDEAYENRNYVETTKRGSEVISKREYVGQQGLTVTFMSRVFQIVFGTLLMLIPCCAVSPILFIYRIGRMISRFIMLPSEIRKLKKIKNTGEKEYEENK